jgi:hypothetical protein
VHFEDIKPSRGFQDLPNSQNYFLKWIRIEVYTKPKTETYGPYPSALQHMLHVLYSYRSVCSDDINTVSSQLFHQKHPSSLKRAIYNNNNYYYNYSYSLKEDTQKSQFEPQSAMDKSTLSQAESQPQPQPKGSKFMQTLHKTHQYLKNPPRTMPSGNRTAAAHWSDKLQDPNRQGNELPPKTN